MLEKVTVSLNLGQHQYTRAFGSPNLVNAIAKYHKRFKDLNPLSDVLVTSGGV
jgi:aspartate/methionine/tyrosine aminotransferase